MHLVTFKCPSYMLWFFGKCRRNIRWSDFELFLATGASRSTLSAAVGQRSPGLKQWSFLPKSFLIGRVRDWSWNIWDAKHVGCNSSPLVEKLYRNEYLSGLSYLNQVWWVARVQKQGGAVERAFRVSSCHGGSFSKGLPFHSEKDKGEYFLFSGFRQ